MTKTRKSWLLLLCLPLSGCVTVMDDHVPVSGWPRLKVVEHHVGQAEVHDQCLRYAPPLTTAAGCTLFYFDRREAHIYVSKDFPDAQVLEHERLHAAGFDHAGSSTMSRIWQGWNTQHRQLQARLPSE